jgi:class 3 adenylate cyclase
MAGFAARFADSVLPRFSDPLLERRYRQEQRSRQAWFTVRMTYFGAAGIAVYWVVAFATLDVRTALGIVLDMAWFLPILLIYGWLVGRPSYTETAWADIALYISIQYPLYHSVSRIAATQTTGWAFNAQLCYSLIVAAAFACLNFTAAVRPFCYLVAASIAYLATVLITHGYPRDVVTHTLQNYVFFALIMIFLNAAMDRKTRAMFLARTRLAAEREKSERLLANMLPEPVAERLKSQQAIADQFDDIVVIFIDLVGFTPLSQQLGPARIVELLNAFFERADHGTDLFELEKVKTIGDAYMAVTNAITHPPRPHKAAIDFAVWLRGEALKVGRNFGVDLRLHVGIASGPAIGGVISAKRLSYDYWGHTVNLAARLQDSVGADGIAVSEPVWRAARDSYPFHDRRSVELKGVGATAVYDVDLPAG